MIHPGMKVRIIKYHDDGKEINRILKEMVLYRIYENYIITGPIPTTNIKGIAYVYDRIKINDKGLDEYYVFGIEEESNETMSKFHIHKSWKYEYEEPIKYSNEYPHSSNVFLLTPEGRKEYKLEGDKLIGKYQPEFTGSPVIIDEKTCVGMAIFVEGESLFVPNFEVIR